MNIGKRILEIRKKNKLSQEEFSEMFNVTRQTISSWENSKSYPDVETIVKISDKFNISLDILLKENKEMIKSIDKNIRKNQKLKLIIIVLLIILSIMLCVIVVLNKDEKVSDKENALSLIIYGNDTYSFSAASDNFVMDNGKINFTRENSLIQITGFDLDEKSKLNYEDIEYSYISVYFDDALWGMVEYIQNENISFKEWLNETLLLEMVSLPCRDNFDEEKCEIGRSNLINQNDFPNNMKIYIDYCIRSECLSEVFYIKDFSLI